MTLIPVDGNGLDWPRRVANAVNRLMTGSVQRSGTKVYTAPTISNPPTQAEIQAIANALDAIAERLK